MSMIWHQTVWKLTLIINPLINHEYRVNWLHTNEPPVIHMDLKPDNILFDNEHRIKVCDFGLSKFKEGAKAIINQPTGFVKLLLGSNNKE
jgi:serine/threonine protein kinase